MEPIDKKENISLEKAYNSYAKWLEGKELSKTTKIAYSTDIKQLYNFLQSENITDLSLVDHNHLNKFQQSLSKKGCKPVSLARKINAFRNFFNLFLKKGYIKNNPVSSITSPKFDKNPPRILSKMEYRALRDSCKNNPRTYVLIELFLQTGIKVSEAANLKICDFQNNKIIIKSNSNKQREIPLPPSAKKALEKYLSVRPTGRCQNIFITKNDTPLLVRNMTTILMRSFRETEIKNASLNSLRHTWIYHQITYGIPLQLVSQLAGHKRISTTAIYLAFIEKKASNPKTKLKEL